MLVGSWVRNCAFAGCVLKMISLSDYIGSKMVDRSCQTFATIQHRCHDLRRAGLPAEFKHITKRRKRK